MIEPAVLRPETSFTWRRWVNIAVIVAGFYELHRIITALGQPGSHPELEGVARVIAGIIALSLVIYMVAPTAEQLAKIKWMGRAFGQSPDALGQQSYGYGGYGQQWGQSGYDEQDVGFGMEPEPEMPEGKGG